MPVDRDTALTPAQQSELQFLRGQVDMWQDKVYEKNPLPNAQLTRYVSELRAWGKVI